MGVHQSLQEKHSRLKRLKRLSELEVAMCRCLDETPKLTVVLQSGQVPSEDELQSYRGLVGRLEKKKVGADSSPLLLSLSCLSPLSE